MLFTKWVILKMSNAPKTAEMRSKGLAPFFFSTFLAPKNAWANFILGKSQNQHALMPTMFAFFPNPSVNPKNVSITLPILLKDPVRLRSSWIMPSYENKKLNVVLWLISFFFTQVMQKWHQNKKKDAFYIFLCSNSYVL